MKTAMIVSRFVLMMGLLGSFFGYGQQMGGGMRPGGFGGNQSMYGQNMGNNRPTMPNIAQEMANKEVKWLKENIALTKDQQKAVKKLYNDYADQQRDAIKDIVGPAGGQPSEEAVKQIRETMLFLNEEKETQLKPLISPEQWTRYQSKKEDMQRDIGGIRPKAQ
jgi:hypothetical protein